MTLAPGCAEKARSMASSALMVLPDPVGAPSSTLSSLWYSTWKACAGDQLGSSGPAQAAMEGSRPPAAALQLFECLHDSPGDVSIATGKLCPALQAVMLV